MYKKFVRQLSSGTKSIGFYVCVDHSIISPIWESYLAFSFGELLPQHPRMINVLIDTFDFNSSVKKAKGLKLPLPELNEFLTVEAERILPKLETSNDLEKLLISDENCHFFSSFDCRVIALSALKVLRGDGVSHSLQHAQSKFEHELKHQIFIKERLNILSVSS